jgi:hypothetical protein
MDEKTEFRPQGGDLKVKEGHQEVDFSVRMIVVSVVFLVIGTIGVMLVSVAILKGLEWWEQKHDAQITPMQEQLNKQRATPKQPASNTPSDLDQRAQEESHIQKAFPEPRLQYDDARDMQELRSTEAARLMSTGKNPDGSVHIPIAQAMELLSKEGLPPVSGPFVPSVPLPAEPITSAPDTKARAGTK